ncbi:MAG: hypothetical protein AAF311_15670, partial [Pseudomonadota bacterium]
MSELDRLPVIIGAGQDMRPVPDTILRDTDGADTGKRTTMGWDQGGETLDDAPSPADIAGRALSRAFEDAGIAPRGLDVCFGVRLFSDSGPVFPNPFGGSNNFPASVCRRAGSSAQRYIYGPVGGERPQTHVADAARMLMSGEARTVAIVGGEAAANIRAATRSGAQPNWVEVMNEPLEDAGPYPEITPGWGGFMIHQQAIAHRINAPVYYYALMETARRGAMGESRETYVQTRMSPLLQHLAAVARNNPLSFVRQDVSGDDIVRPGPRNPFINSPYTKAMIARDGVNLGAAVILTTYGEARAMGVAADRMTFLHGHHDAKEPRLITRARLDRSAAQQRVLESTGRDADLYDLYSCFPIAPLEAMRVLGLQVGDQPLTVTGGLPFFGGPGNNYSLHAIAEMHQRLRGTEKVGAVYANGGMMTKHAVGRYGGHPPKEA